MAGDRRVHVPDQLEAIYEVHEARRRIMAGRQIGEWHKLGADAGPEIVVILEEYGALREDVAGLKGGPKRLAAVDYTLEQLFRLCRMTGITW